MMMVRSRPFAVACLPLLLSLAILSGCDDGSRYTGENPPEKKVANGTTANGDTASGKPHPAENPATAGNNDEQAKPVVRKPPLNDWKKPALAIVLSGEQHGYIEPCGCTENQSGGVSRRADLFRQVREKGWAVAAFDLGGIVKRNRRQSRIKFETMLAALHDMQYQALALGPQELRFGPEYLVSQHQPNPDDPLASLAFLCANVVLFDVPDLGTPAHSKVVELNGVKIGVTAVLGDSLAKTVLPEGSNSDIRFTAAETALAEALKTLEEQKPDLLLLLSHASREESDGYARKFPQLNLILTAGGPEDGHQQATFAGKTMIVDVGHKGKYAGVVGYYPDDTQHPLHFELVDLDQQRFQDTPKMIEHMRYYQKRLQDERIVAVEHLEHPIAHPGGAKFAGAEKCGECHAKSFAKWQETPHAHAFESLEHARKGQIDYHITRVYDAECLACHVTGWEPQNVLRYDSGFINQEFARNDSEREMARLLKGQQCESCHGPGSKHVELVEAGQTEESLKSVRVTLEQAREKVCFTCHDYDNSPNFKFDAYWEKVKHPWRD